MAAVDDGFAACRVKKEYEHGLRSKEETINTEFIKDSHLKTPIVCVSYHHKNTERVAQAMAEELEGVLVSIGQTLPEIDTYDLIGFGSGIYGGKFHKTLIQFAKALPNVTGKRAFVFSTMAGGG
ncbi:MAG TPA: flavodoxin domain-containing protein [Candidatus Bathyarchaeia archaeon]|nr:flavodoxin domain-containing protein [Candidatus Bathyarchaeia archaeon]